MERRRFAVFAIFLVMCFSTGYANTPSKMGKGQDAKIEEFPFSAVVWAEGHMCGGAIIDERHILTAAHCTMFDENEWHVIQGLWGSVIIAGTEHSSDHTPDVVFGISDFIWHPKFNYTPMYHDDIGIIKLNTSIVFNDRLQPIKLPTNEAPESGEAITIGWEKGAYPHNNTKVLKKIPMHIEMKANCSQDYQPQLQSQMCASPDSELGPCKGDSGTPLILNGEVIGILSVGTYCTKGRTLVYTHVHSYLDWIKEVIAR